MSNGEASGGSLFPEFQREVSAFRLRSGLYRRKRSAGILSLAFAVFSFLAFVSDREGNPRRERLAPFRRRREHAQCAPCSRCSRRLLRRCPRCALPEEQVCPLEPMSCQGSPCAKCPPRADSQALRVAGVFATTHNSARSSCRSRCPDQE